MSTARPTAGTECRLSPPAMRVTDCARVPYEVLPLLGLLLIFGAVGCGQRALAPSETEPDSMPAVAPQAERPTSEPGLRDASLASNGVSSDAARPAVPTADAEPTSLAPRETLPAKTTATTTHQRPAPQTVYRPSDTRPQHDDGRLSKLGIHKYESRRLKLYTDIDPKLAEPLPRFLDASYDAWEDYFGPLPPNREGTLFQVTGYLMADPRLFREAGLLPADLPGFVNGRHRGAEFWMLDQEYDYYRRHLMIHEATHCFMTIMPDTRAPWWYLEGVAEQFGTHRVEPDGAIRFRVMPHDKTAFEGLGRIKMIRDAVAKNQAKKLEDLAAFKAEDFLQNETYAWSWALCEFLGKHPRYRDRFRDLGRHLTGNQFRRAFRDLFDRDLADVKSEWPLFVHGLMHGYDIERAAVDFQAGRPLDADPAKNRSVIVADRGWQSSRLRLETGRRYVLAASGQFALAQQPKPWISEPQGISFRYWDGRPLGMLLATIRSDDASDAAAEESMLRVIPVGREASFEAPTSGTLYLRLNESWSELADNSGQVEIEVRPAP